MTFDPFPDRGQLGEAEHAHEPEEADELHDLGQLGHLRGGLVDSSSHQLGQLRPGDRAHQVNAKPASEVVLRDESLLGDQRARRDVSVPLARLVGGEEVGDQVDGKENRGEPEPCGVKGVRCVAVLVGYLEGQHDGVHQHQEDHQHVPGQPARPLWVHHPLDEHRRTAALGGLLLDVHRHEALLGGGGRALLLDLVEGAGLQTDITGLLLKVLEGARCGRGLASRHRGPRHAADPVAILLAAQPALALLKVSICDEGLGILRLPRHVARRPIHRSVDPRHLREPLALGEALVVVSKVVPAEVGLALQILVDTAHRGRQPPYSPFRRLS
mmetsp:Transcript_114022/g.333230  ORF Transcript_114022/g.333230 Transcript_114022/m.333230 type:complete len:328 (-) Transcript_114022:134-1117(-)